MGQFFQEFKGDRRLLWIAEEWERYAPQLAEWAMERLANRRDVWSQYTLRNGEIRVVMLPTRDKRKKGAEMVTMNKLIRHFSGHSPAGLIGLHSISDHATCKWFAVDVDLHDESVANADEIAFANFTAALAWANRLRDQGMDPLLLDSNGVGGYHVWALLDKEYPLADVFDFAAQLREDWADFGLPRKPEIFPPKREVSEDDLPYTLRLPGRHHTRRHYTRVWNFDPLASDNEWLEGGEAIEVMLATRPTPLPISKSKKAKAASPEKTAAAAKAAKAPRSGKTKVPASMQQPTSDRPKVCIDLDGVLARYDGYISSDRIGAPLPGAVEFAEQIAKFADIIIFTTRCAPGQDTVHSAEGPTAKQARVHVIEWLEKHRIPYADVYMGQGKPFAAAFIDDRAIPCRPQVDDAAFSKTVTDLKKLLKRK